MNNPRFGVVTTSSAELEHLAAYLDRLNLLYKYAHPFLSTGTLWERLVRRLPVVGPAIGRIVSKRKAPAQINVERIVSAAPMEEIASRAFAGRLPRVAEVLSRLRTQRLQRAALRISQEVDVLVASHGAASQAFQSMPHHVFRVLNYPSIHHRSQQQIYEDEGRADPEFGSLSWFGRHDVSRFDEYDLECELADLILVGSNFSKRSFAEQGVNPEKVVVVPYGVDLELFSPALDQHAIGQDFNVLYVGNVKQVKGIRYLLDGFKIFGKENATLNMVGSYLGGIPDLDGQHRNIEHTQRVPREDLPAIYRRASVFVLPSLFEGLGMVVLEAMACGIPVIVTDRGPDQIVRDGIDGFVVPANDAEVIADRLDALYYDPHLREAMGRNARERALSYSWDSYSSAALEAVVSAL